MEYIVYSITCQDKDVQSIYVGSTKDFVDRQRKHIYKSKDETNNLKLYNTIRDNGGWVNWEIKILEICTRVTKSDARIREQFFYDKLEADLNMIKPHTTKEERRLSQHEYKKQYKVEHKEELSKMSKQYRVKNQEKIVEQKKQYNIENKEKILEKAKHYYIENRDERLEYQNQYALSNKEKIASRNSEKLYCEPCGLYHSRVNKVRHYRSKQHIANLAIFTDK